MNFVQQARQAYGASNAVIRSARSAEHQILAEATARLRAAVDSGFFPSIAKAIHDNRRLWTRLVADVADDDNGLPAELRGRLFYLGEFTNSHSRAVLAGKAHAGVLVEINTAVLRGLSGQQAGSAAAVPSEVA
ncbi:flagellar biosynthesis regulator FlaF [Pseudoroseicyclus aestuarii]|uniref:Flagellar protein FlaF n=1 Tax=Pseudoroseicyclus aestuarii TaxID=1795041 RepID=A0A318SW18_9RHOB|nr:flagellar biosynthesis regulator FlaF [Pseudoroseicyclus aestuarii]PYE84569.1 flagellar protein FlaF [Pseudoroseicyclus aestuarii]